MTLNKLMNVNIDNLRAKLFVLTLAGLGFVRGLEWIAANKNHLKNVSDLYVKMSEFIDINSAGLLLVVASLLLFFSMFFDGRFENWALIIGGVVCGSIHILYGMISVGNANLATTYYTGMLIGIMQFLLALSGAIGVWKRKH